jgi:internalin A
MSELALQLIEKEKREKTGRLDLGRCGLTDWPEELFELTHLEVLNLGRTIWDESLDKWINSKNPGPKNALERISERITTLKKLTGLHISSNKISDIRVLKKMTKLQSLDLSDNQITDIQVLENLVVFGDVRAKYE